MIRIFVADDHSVVRQGVKQIVGDQPDMKVIGEGRTAQDVLDFVRGNPVDLAIIDITMPGRSGVEVVRDLKQEFPRLPVLVLSMHPAEYAVRVLKAGAAGYIQKESASTELVDAIRKAIRGGKYVGSAIAEQLAVDLETPTDKPLHETLSDREYEVLRLMAMGKTVSTIAEDLALSVKTVSSYRRRILDKMNMKTNAELIRYTIKAGLVE
jgi:two-component system, NarL family, invasion response regulator UvrY